MQAVREIATNRVLYLFEDTKKVAITEAGLVTPIRALDIRPGTHDVISAPPPPIDFVGGKLAFDGQWHILDLNHFKSVQHARLADIRWRKETGGVTLPIDQTIQTTREAQAQIASTYSSLKDGLVTAADWKAEGGWVSVTLNEFQPIAQAVAAHVQACFAAERQVSDQIEAAQTISELKALRLSAEFQTAYDAITGQ